jgi:hypothetical protein
MHEHTQYTPQCEHNNLKHCKECDVVYCEDCKKEWKQGLENPALTTPYCPFPNYTPYYSTPNIPFGSSWTYCNTCG